jgi:hypothetical protein
VAVNSETAWRVWPGKTGDEWKPGVNASGEREPKLRAASGPGKRYKDKKHIKALNGRSGEVVDGNVGKRSGMARAGRGDTARDKRSRSGFKVDSSQAAKASGCSSNG